MVYPSEHKMYSLKGVFFFLNKSFIWWEKVRKEKSCLFIIHDWRIFKEDLLFLVVVQK